jgi:hypothetical protein
MADSFQSCIAESESCTHRWAARLKERIAAPPVSWYWLRLKNKVLGIKESKSCSLFGVSQQSEYDLLSVTQLKLN